MGQVSDSAFPGLEDHYREAAGVGFPAFVRAIEDSTPINATPYVVALTVFLREELPPAKSALRDALASSLSEVPALGLRPEILLIGGSFLAPDATPNDLDCVLFYSREKEPTTDLAYWQAQRRRHGIYLRLMPIEMDPIMVLKSALFFGVLYTRGRAAAPQLRGLVLVDCSK